MSSPRAAALEARVLSALRLPGGPPSRSKLEPSRKPSAYRPRPRTAASSRAATPRCSDDQQQLPLRTLTFIVASGGHVGGPLERRGARQRVRPSIAFHIGRLITRHHALREEGSSSSGRPPKTCVMTQSLGRKCASAAATRRTAAGAERKSRFAAPMCSRSSSCPDDHGVISSPRRRRPGCRRRVA